MRILDDEQQSVDAALADLYGLPVNWFLQPHAVLGKVCYRALKRIGVKDKRQFEADRAAMARGL